MNPRHMNHKFAAEESRRKAEAERQAAACSTVVERVVAIAAPPVAIAAPPVAKRQPPHATKLNDYEAGAEVAKHLLAAAHGTGTRQPSMASAAYAAGEASAKAVLAVPAKDLSDFQRGAAYAARLLGR